MSRNAYSVLWRGNAFWVEGNAKIPGGGRGEAPLGTPPLYYLLGADKNSREAKCECYLYDLERAQ